MTQESAQAIQPQLPLRKRAERAAGRVGMRLVVRPLRALPLPLARSFGRGMGRVLFYTLGRYRRVALKNLNLIYGRELDARARYQMALDVFKNFGETAAEFLKLPRMGLTEVDALVIVEGEEHMRRALEMGQGVLLITGHFGNWEFLARWLNLHGYPLNVVARRANDPEADKILTDTRTDGGAQVFNRGNSARAVMQCLKKKEIVALLPDQNAGDVFVPFLGVRTGTVDGPAIIHIRTQSPLLFSWCVRTPDERFHITFEPPVIIAPTGDRAHDIETITACINARLDAQVRKHPTQWLWLHNRWKATPEVFLDASGAASPQGNGTIP
jgi:KDO2-lipid IV(A) lauroyltransferase